MKCKFELTSVSKDGVELENIPAMSYVHSKDLFSFLRESDDLKKLLDPSHYDILGNSVLYIIKHSLTPEEFKGFCMGNILKYRLRAGKKANNSLESDIKKANDYEELYKFYYMDKDNDK